MSEHDAILQTIRDAILTFDAPGAANAAQAALDAGLDPLDVLNTTVAATAVEVGERFDSGEFFLPHLVMAGNAIEKVSDVLQSGVEAGTLGERKVVVIGTVEGDMHGLGKNIVAMMLRASGFEVHDLGVDVKSETFIRRAEEVGADIIALSSLMTTTMPYQREVIEDLTAQGLRDRYQVMIGGGPITTAWAEEIGADGYGVDVIEAVQVAKVLVGLD